MSIFHLYYWPSASSATLFWNFSWGCRPGSWESFASPCRSQLRPVLSCIFHLLSPHSPVLRLHPLHQHPVWWNAGSDCEGVRWDTRFPGSIRPGLLRLHGDTGGVEPPSAAESPLRLGSDHLSKTHEPVAEREMLLENQIGGSFWNSTQTRMCLFGFN